jgi:hypothetical protein
MSIKKSNHRGRNPRNGKGRKSSPNRFKVIGVKHRIKSEDKTPSELIFALRECQKDYLSEEMKRYSNLKVVID